jgi:hypothetical protein
LTFYWCVFWHLQKDCFILSYRQSCPAYKWDEFSILCYFSVSFWCGYKSFSHQVLVISYFFKDKNLWMDDNSKYNKTKNWKKCQHYKKSTWLFKRPLLLPFWNTCQNELKIVEFCRNLKKSSFEFFAIFMGSSQKKFSVESYGNCK